MRCFLTFWSSWTFILDSLKRYTFSNISLIQIFFTWSCTLKWWPWILLFTTSFTAILLQLIAPAFPDVHSIEPGMHQKKKFCRASELSSCFEITLIGFNAWMQFAPISKSTEIFSSLAMSLATVPKYLHFFSFSDVIISGIWSLEYSFGSFTYWVLLSLDNGCFETISPSINNGVTFYCHLGFLCWLKFWYQLI